METNVSQVGKAATRDAMSPVVEPNLNALSLSMSPSTTNAIIPW